MVQKVIKMNDAKLITELKQNAQSNKELFIKCRENYFKALALNETLEKIGNECKTKVLKEHDFKISSEWIDSRKEYKKDEIIREPKQDYLMTDKEFVKYAKLVHEERIKKGFKYSHYNLTFDYKSRTLLDNAEKEFLTVALKILPKEFQKKLKSIVDNYHWKHTKEFLDISLKFDLK